MTLSLTSPIKAADIAGVKVYKEGKVFLIQGLDGSEIVIKADAVGADQVKNTTLAIKAIDPAAKAKLLTVTEVDQLALWCSYVADIEAFYADLIKDGVVKSSPTSKSSDAAKELDETITDARMFSKAIIKMNKLTIHHIQDAVEARGTGGKDLLRAFAKSLKDTGGLEMLGKVVAADMFNQNFDRFDPDRGNRKPYKIGPFTFNTRVIVNYTNILIQHNGAGYSPTALDHVDPGGRNDHPGVKFSDKAAQNWGGDAITDKARRKKFAGDIVHDLELLLNPKKSKFSLKTKLGRDAATRLNAGMVAGAREICAYLDARALRKGPMSAGLKEHYNAYKQVA